MGKECEALEDEGDVPLVGRTALHGLAVDDDLANGSRIARNDGRIAGPSRGHEIS
jgi:hypothetical protein